VRVAFHEYAALARDLRAASGWRTRAQLALRGPGWTPPPTAPTAGGALSEPAGD
jgi:hypothetical protein